MPRSLEYRGRAQSRSRTWKMLTGLVSISTVQRAGRPGIGPPGVPCRRRGTSPTGPAENAGTGPTSSVDPRPEYRLVLDPGVEPGDAQQRASAPRNDLARRDAPPRMPRACGNSPAPGARPSRGTLLLARARRESDPLGRQEDNRRRAANDEQTRAGSSSIVRRDMRSQPAIRGVPGDKGSAIRGDRRGDGPGRRVRRAMKRTVGVEQVEQVERVERVEQVTRN